MGEVNGKGHADQEATAWENLTGQATPTRQASWWEKATGQATPTREATTWENLTGQATPTRQASWWETLTGGGGGGGSFGAGYSLGEKFGKLAVIVLSLAFVIPGFILDEFFPDKRGTSRVWLYSLLFWPLVGGTIYMERRLGTSVAFFGIQLVLLSLVNIVLGLVVSQSLFKPRLPLRAKTIFDRSEPLLPWIGWLGFVPGSVLSDLDIGSALAISGTPTANDRHNRRKHFGSTNSGSHRACHVVCRAGLHRGSRLSLDLRLERESCGSTRHGAQAHACNAAGRY